VDQQRLATAAERSGRSGHRWGSEITEGVVNGHSCLMFADRPPSVAAVLEESLRWGEREFVIHGSRRVSFEAHHRAVCRIGARLREHGVRPGDRVALLGANSASWVASFYAILSTGAVAVLCNAWWSEAEIRHAIAETTPILALVDDRRAERVDGEVPRLSLEDLAEHFGDATSGERLEAVHTVAEDDPAVVLFTSGTTGLPKGATLSHRSLVANLQGLLMVSGRLPRETDDPDARHSIGVVGLPIFHIGGLQLLLVALTSGNTSVFLPGRFDAAEVLRLVETERATVLSAVPTMIQRIVHHPDVTVRDTSTLRTIVMGGSPVSKEMLERVNAAFPSARSRIGQSYGMTELGGVVATGVGADLASHPGSAGRLMPVAEVRIDAPDGDRVGEIVVRSPAVMDGYWGRPDDPILDADGWLRTGDLGRVDADRFLYLTGRAKDLIIRGGENIAAVHVEARILAHPGVREVAIVGLQHADLGEEVAAAVVVAADSTLDAAALAEYVRSHLAYFEVPSRWWIRAEALPHNDAGKLVKRLIAQNWQDCAGLKYCAGLESCG
jgi:long-chain acyl-CoA synthetase